MRPETGSAGPWRASVPKLLADVPSGARVGVSGFHFTRLPIAQLLELRTRRGLTYIAWGGGLALELLLGAGAVTRAELTFSSLDLFGLAPRFRRAVEDGSLDLREWTALGMIKALQARSQHLGFEVMQEIAGSDLGGAWSAFQPNPFGADTVPQAAVPALQLDVFLLHAGRADDVGNVEIRGARGLDLSAMFAADRVLVTVEERVDRGSLGAPGAFILPRTFVAALAMAPFGAFPSSCLPHYPADMARLASVARADPARPLDEELLIAGEETRGRLRRTAQLSSEAIVAGLSRLGEDAVAAAGAEDESGAPASRDEVMVCALARTLEATSVATIGSASPLPAVAYLLAKHLWHPELPILSFNGGLVDIGWRPMTLSLAELLDFRSAAAHAGGDETYHWYYQQSRITHEVVATAQLDRRGRSNTIAVRRPDGALVRLPGQGGMADVANLHANFLLYLPRQDRRNTVERVDVVSASRAWHDPALRRRYGLRAGHVIVLTDLGRFEFDADRQALVLTHVHPGVALEEVRERTGWSLLVADELQTTPPPAPDELRALRRVVDPLGIRRLELSSGAERHAVIDHVLALEQQVVADALALDPTNPEPIGEYELESR